MTLREVRNQIPIRALTCATHFVRMEGVEQQRNVPAKTRRRGQRARVLQPDSLDDAVAARR